MVHCYRVLGIDPDAPQSAIDVKYQNLINMASDLGRFDRDLVSTYRPCSILLNCSTCFS